MDLGPNATTIAIDFPGTQTSESRRRKLLSAACQFVPLKLRKRDCKRIGIYRPVHAPGPQRMPVLARVPMMAVLSLTGRTTNCVETIFLNPKCSTQSLRLVTLGGREDDVVIQLIWS